MKEKLTKKTLNIPLEDYNFLYDFDNDFFENKYPTMWKNVCFYVENNYSKKIDEESREFEMNYLLEVIKWEWNIPSNYNFDVNEYFTHLRQQKKKNIAIKIMEKNLKLYKKQFYVPTKFIMTKSEIKEQDMKKLQAARNLYKTLIDKNWIKAMIDKKSPINTFQYKDWPEYVINTRMIYLHVKDLTEREKEIISNCAEAWVHYSMIAEIFWTKARRMLDITKKLWYKLYATPQNLIKNSLMIKVLDEDGVFLIEKLNTSYKNNS